MRGAVLQCIKKMSLEVSLEVINGRRSIRQVERLAERT